MKKSYIKPTVDLVSLITEEKVTTDDSTLDGTMGFESNTLE